MDDQEIALETAPLQDSSAKPKPPSAPVLRVENESADAHGPIYSFHCPICRRKETLRKLGPVIHCGKSFNVM